MKAITFETLSAKIADTGGWIKTVLSLDIQDSVNPKVIVLLMSVSAGTSKSYFEIQLLYQKNGELCYKIHKDTFLEIMDEYIALKPKKFKLGTEINITGISF